MAVTKTNIKSVAYLTRHIKPDMDKRIVVYKVFQILSLVIAIGGFAAYMVLSVSGVLVMTDKTWYILIPFICVPLGIFAFALFTASNTTCRFIVNFVIQVKQYDKVLIAEVLPEFVGNSASNLQFVNKLISTKNLADYKVVGNVLIAKRSILISDEEAKVEYEQYVAQHANTTAQAIIINNNVEQAIVSSCPYCGANVEEQDKYCQYCGRRLK